MITNGRVQLWPFLRVALFLVVGVLIWRRLGLSRSFLCVDVGVRGFAFRVCSILFLFAQASHFSDCCAFYYGGGRRLVAHHLFS